MPIRVATARDLDSVLHIQREALASGGAGLYSFEVLEMWAHGLSIATYETAVSNGHICVSVDGANRVTGFSQFDPTTGVIGFICVSCQYHGEGIGRELVKECLTRAHSSGLESVKIHAPLDAVEFYERLEFICGETSTRILADGAAVTLRAMSRPVMLPAIREHIAALEESVAFFAPGKGRNYQKELIVIRAFLRGLNIEFKEEEFSQGDDPPDVCFHEARFEVKAIYDDGRLMHKEYKDKLKAARSAFFSSDLLESVTPKDIPLDELIQKVVSAAIDLGQKYSSEERKDIDLIVYANLQHIWQITPSAWPDLSLLEAQGWRSVSFTRGASTSCVLVAGEDAPEFLRQRLGRLLHG